MRSALFILSVLIYAFFSSPTPNIFGWAELVCLVCLGISISHIKTINLMLSDTLMSPLGLHRIFVLWMLSVPLLIGVINGHSLHDIIRDLIPILLLCLPMIIPDIKPSHLAIVLAAGGAAFSLRYLFYAMPNVFNIGIVPAHDSLLYLANSPLVPFASIIGFSWLLTLRPSSLIYPLIGCAMFIITMASMAFMVQRAPIVLVSIACIVLTVIRVSHTPFKTTVIIGLLLISAAPALSIITQITSGLIEKSIAVGTNSRLDEMFAALQYSSLFGHGWGMEWQSPAVGDYWVRYTHNMTMYYWLKAGIIGGMLSVLFIYVWIKESIGLMRHNLAIGLAIIIPLCIHFFLYTGYKTFDISLLLALIILCKKDRPPSLS